MITRSAALVALLLLGGCTDAAPKPASAPVSAGPVATPPAAAPTTCAPGRVTFAKAADKPLVTGATKPMSIKARKGGRLTGRLFPLASPEVTVSAGPEVPAEFVYQEFLAAYEDREGPLVPWGTHYDLPDYKIIPSGPVSRGVVLRFVDTVTAPFTYTCGTTSSPGTVTTWRNGGGTVLFTCDEPDPADRLRAAIDEVRKLRC